MVDIRLGAVEVIELDPPVDVDGITVPAPSLAISILRPDAVTDGPYTPAYDSTLDKYVYSYAPTLQGEHIWRAVNTGTGQAAVEGSFYVYPAFAIATDAWQPSLVDVASLVPTRTIDAAGTMQNTFTTTTTPTATQVSGYIARIVAEIVGVVGDVPSANFSQAKHTATLGVAWLIERSYPPTADVQNVANDFVADYRASLQLLQRAARSGEGGGRAFSMTLDSYTWPEV